MDIAFIIELPKKCRDMPMDFADAALIVASEKTGIRKIISIDFDLKTCSLPRKVKIRNIFC